WKGWAISHRQKQKKLIMLPSETMIWQPEFTDKTLSRKPGAVQNVLSTVRLGMEVLRHSGYTITREDSLVAATLLTQNLFTHGYVLGKL
ncbi:hypothetical protein U9911_23225, partial [Escherichia coli]